MKSAIFLFCITFLLGFKAWSESANIQSLQFQTRYDEFTLSKQGNQWSLGGQRVDARVVDGLVPALTQSLRDECPLLPPRADVRIQVNSDKGQELRKVYIAERLIKAGDHCLEVSGEGIYMLPLHRDWLISKDNDRTLHLAQKIELKLPNMDAIHLEREANGERFLNQTTQYFLDQQFLDRLTQSLRNYKVTSRWHEAQGARVQSFTLKNGNTELHFHQVGSSLWAIQRPGTAWLEASSDWSFWQNMKASDLFDRHHETLTIITSKEQPEDQKLRALSRLGENWSEAIRQALFTVLQSEEQSEAVKLQSLQIIRRRPSDSNSMLLRQTLSQESNLQVKQAITQALRIRDPRGPEIKPDMPQEELQKALEYWRP